MDNRNLDWAVYSNRSLDGGLTWLASDIRLDTNLFGEGDTWYPQIAESGSSVYVVWLGRSRGSVGWSVFLNRSLDSGATWLPSEIRLGMDVPISWQYPRICALGDSVNVTWSTGPEVLLNRSLDRGATWLASSIRLDTDLPGTAKSMFPQITTSGDFAYVTWGDRRDQSIKDWYDIYFNRVPIR
jgi:hypothetical protein